MSLQSILQEMSAQSKKRIPPEVLEVMLKANAELAASGIGDNALKAGDTFPGATLTDATGTEVAISSLLEKGPAIFSFYRGGWCPYCNMELKAYQDILDDIQSAGASFAAITPESPDNSLTTREKNELAFPVLTDADNALAGTLGIRFELPVALQKIYAGFGIDLPGVNAQTGWTLPIPATYVVGADRVIILADVDLDYTRRLEPADALAALKTPVTA